MHQRRSGPAVVTVPPGGDLTAVATTAATTSSTSTATTTTRKRRKKGVVSGRKRKTTSSSSSQLSWQLQQIYQDEDTLITLIQAVSVLILLGCGITLLLHYFGASSSEYGGDDTTQQQQHAPVPIGSTPHQQEGESPSFFWSITSWILGWNGGNSLMNPLGRRKKRQRMSNGLYPRMDMKPSAVYDIPNTLPFVGDKSDHYAQLRKEYDEKDIPDVTQKYSFTPMPMQDKTLLDGHTMPEPYDIYNCPDHPPRHYPYDWNLLELLHHWEPDNPTIPSDLQLYQGLCVFDFQKDYEKAVNYRRRELPFVVTNDPEVQETVRRWNAPGYMDQLLGSVRHRAEYSESNHFLYWNKPPGQRNGGLPKRPNMRRIQQQSARAGIDLNPLHAPPAQDLKDWKEPTTMMRMTYHEWLSHANLTDPVTGADSVVGSEDPHWYFRLIGCGETGPEGECDQGSSEYLFDELPFFQPRETLYVVDPMEQKGIHCRFGMHGVIAENHFDQSRNAIAVLGGERRYILAHPNQCQRLSLLPKGHPSARHSAVDWSNPDLDGYPEFAEARGNEVVLQPGDVLYLPTNWFHYIISLNLNYQCNTRSGVTPEYMKPIRECGF